jgi:hypothetical protein
MQEETRNRRLAQLNTGDIVTIFEEGQKFLEANYTLREELSFIETNDAFLKKLFDQALDILHYAKSVQRVGRCMRLAVIRDKNWVGGITLGSTFPNIFVRDEALGLRKFVENYKERGLKNPWVKENYLYWHALQTLVNHARSFTFPMFQGSGIGTAAEKLLLTKGVKLWEEKYHDRVYALDNLTDRADSKMFLNNGWQMVGQTKGFSSNPDEIFSQRLGYKNKEQIRNNIGLSTSGKAIHWFVWVKIINSEVLTLVERAMQ